MITLALLKAKGFEFLKVYGWKILAGFALAAAISALSCQRTTKHELTAVQETSAMQSVSITAQALEIKSLRSQLHRQKDREILTKRTARVVDGRTVWDEERVDRSREVEDRSVEELSQRDSLITDLKSSLSLASTRITELETKVTGRQAGGWGLAMGIRTGNVRELFGGGSDPQLELSAGPAFGGVVAGVLISGNLLLSMPRPIPEGGPAFQSVVQVLF